MTISGFSYIRNGFEFGYPFLQAIQSILPICDEFVIAVGDSHDGTREAIVNLNSPKIKIVDTIWDEESRMNGKIFAQQANAAREHLTGGWCFHIQADEIIHERDLEKIKSSVEKYNSDLKVEGLLFHFLNFWGSYDYIRTTRRMHRFEIRIFRNIPTIRSYKDSQGFRNFKTPESLLNESLADKLHVKKIDVSLFHYNYVRNPKLMKKKSDYFHRFWHNDEWLKENVETTDVFYFDNVDEVELYKGSHPKIMEELVKAQDWEFSFDKTKSKFIFRDRFTHKIEKWTGWRIGEYKNYKLI